jgi:hypothetical protein
MVLKAHEAAALNEDDKDSIGSDLIRLIRFSPPFEVVLVFEFIEVLDELDCGDRACCCSSFCCCLFDDVSVIVDVCD